MMMKSTNIAIFLALVVFSIAICLSNSQCGKECLNCPELTVNRLDKITTKLNLLLEHFKINPPAGPDPKPPVCRKLQFNRITSAASPKVIQHIGGAYPAIANGNDIYIAGFIDRFVYRFNSDKGLQPLEKIKLPTGFPTFFDIRDGFLYVTDYINSVYRKPLVGGQFERVITGPQRTAGIKWSPDGQNLFVGLENEHKVLVYNKDFKLVTQFRHCSPSPYNHKITFGLDGNIRISSDTPNLCLYSPTSPYKALSPVTIHGVGRIAGHFQHCDGTIIMADYSGKLHFLDKNYKVLHTITGFGGLGDVALTTDGTLYVTGYTKNIVHVYPSLF